MGYPFRDAGRLNAFWEIYPMNRMKRAVFTAIPATALLYGSFLCSRLSQKPNDMSKGALLLLISGFTFIAIGFMVSCLLIKLKHPDNTLLQITVFSASVSLLIYAGTHLITVRPFISEVAGFPPGLFALGFGSYLILFGVLLLSFLIKSCIV